MPQNSLINSDGFNSDPRTYMLHDTVATLGQLSDECSVLMVVGLPLKAVAKGSIPSFACQVRRNSLHDEIHKLVRLTLQMRLCATAHGNL
jgi:hypothetical protein